MTSREPDDFDDLENDLLALGDALDLPAPPPADVASAVRARLRTPSAPPARRVRRARWKVVTAIVLTVVAVTAATPQGRAAVVQILRFAGIELRVGDPQPAPAKTAELPGEGPVSLAQARSQVKFPIKLPAELGAPDQISLSDNARVVSLHYPGGIRLDEFDGSLSLVFRKELGPPWPEETTVAGGNGWWISQHHGLTYLPRANGVPVPLRLAGPTLAWNDAAASYRLEGVASLTRALKIANSVR